MCFVLKLPLNEMIFFHWCHTPAALQGPKDRLPAPTFHGEARTYGAAGIKSSLCRWLERIVMLNVLNDSPSKA